MNVRPFRSGVKYGAIENWIGAGDVSYTTSVRAGLELAKTAPIAAPTPAPIPMEIGSMIDVSGHSPPVHLTTTGPAIAPPAGPSARSFSSAAQMS